MTSRALRVLHVIDSLWGGGAELSLLAYLHAASHEREVGHRVVALRGDELTRKAAADLPVPAVLGSPRTRPRWSDARLVQAQIDEFRPDVVNSTLVRATLAAGRATARSEVPLIVTLTAVAYDVDSVHGSLKRRLGIRLFHALHRMALRRGNVTVHALSQPVADRGVELFGLDPTRVKVVPYLRPDPAIGVFFGREEMRRRMRVAQGDPVLVYTAREHPIKGHVALLEASALVRRRWPSLRVILAGPPGEATHAIDAAIARLELEDAVLRLGNRSDVPDLLAASDLFVSPSESEGLGASVIEAMGMGLPVVAVDNGGIREVVGEEHPGLVPNGDVEELAARIGLFLGDEALQNEVARAGRSRFEDKFEVTTNLWRYRQMYEEAAGVSD